MTDLVLPSIEQKERWIVQLMTNSDISVEDRLAKISSTNFVVDAEKYNEICKEQRMNTDSINIKLAHPARSRYANLLELLDGVITVGKFVSRMKKIGEKEGKSLFPKNEDYQKKYYNSYTGDVFEVFVEALIKLHGTDRRIGINDYKPLNQTNGEQDFGVDGYGIGTNGKPATVQVKFRSEMDYILTANTDHLTNFKNNSHEMYNVDFNDTENMLIVTTAKGVHHTTMQKMLNNKVRCLALDGIEKLVDNNNAFWMEFQKLVQPPK